MFFSFENEFKTTQSVSLASAVVSRKGRHFLSILHRNGLHLPGIKNGLRKPVFSQNLYLFATRALLVVLFIRILACNATVRLFVILIVYTLATILETKQKSLAPNVSHVTTI